MGLRIYQNSPGTNWHNIFSNAVKKEMTACAEVATQILGEERAVVNNGGAAAPVALAEPHTIIFIGHVDRRPRPMCGSYESYHSVYRERIVEREFHHHHYNAPAAATSAAASADRKEKDEKEKKEKDNTAAYVALAVVGAIATYFLGQAWSQISQSNEDLEDIQKFEDDTLSNDERVVDATDPRRQHVDMVRDLVETHKRVFTKIQRDQYFKFAVAAAVIAGAATGAAYLYTAVAAWKVASIALFVFTTFLSILKCGFDSGDRRFVRLANDLRDQLAKLKSVKQAISNSPPAYDSIGSAYIKSAAAGSVLPMAQPVNQLGYRSAPPQQHMVGVSSQYSQVQHEGQSGQYLTPPPFNVGSVPANGVTGEVSIAINANLLSPSAPPA